MKITIPGCNPEPLSSYLKALGLFRIISLQASKNTTASWESNNFILETELDRQQLLSFILNEYKPSPVISPWNKGSFIFIHRRSNGIYKDIMSSNDPRIKPIQDDIGRLERMPSLSYMHDTLIKFKNRFISNTGNAKKDNTKKDIKKILDGMNNIMAGNEEIQISTLYSNGIEEVQNAVDYFEKNVLDLNRVIAESRATLSDDFVEWADACVVLDPDIKKITAPLLGTGGNEGSLEYGTKFMTYVYEMLLKSKKISGELLESCLFGTDTKNLMKDNIGKFYPGKSGGYNQGNAIESKEFFINPWEYILLIEGLFLWSNSISKRNNPNAKNYLMSPFTVSLFQAGYPSSEVGDAKSSETWIPIWENPIHIQELYTLFATGRAVFTNKDAKTGLEFTQAVKTFGVDRGIKQFIRYITAIRKGIGNFLSIPVSTLNIDYDEKVIHSREINSIISSFKNSRPQNPPASYENILRNLNNAAYNFTLHTDILSAQKILIACGLAEGYASRNTNNFKPLGKLNPIWIQYAYDDSPEFRIALAIASINGDIGNFRQELEPVDESSTRWFNPGLWIQSWVGNTLSQKMAGVVHRRLIKAIQAESKEIPLNGKFHVSPEEVSMYIDGALNENKIETLIPGLSMIDWSKYNADKILSSLQKTDCKYPVNRSYAIIKAALLDDGDSSAIESRLIPLLSANRISDAVKIAERRVFVKNKLYTSISVPNNNNGISIAAALLIPIDLTSHNIYELIYREDEMMKNE